MRTSEYFEKKSGIAVSAENGASGAFVEEAEHYLRVITEADGTYVNAFFDRTFERRRTP